MAKINISFDNTNYLIDESALSTVTAVLKSHLSTIMNGSGATIMLDGTSYNVDSVKLSNIRNDFISHLGTIAGSGKKVVVNGVEYSVDSTKMGNVVAELHTTLNNLKSNGGGSGGAVVNCPIKFGKVYSTTSDFNSSVAVILFEDGSAEIYLDGSLYESVPANTFTFEGTNILEAGELYGVVSQDGTTITAVGLTLTLMDEATSFTFVVGETEALEESITLSNEDEVAISRFSDLTPSVEQLEGATLTITLPDGTIRESGILSTSDGSLSVYSEDIRGTYGLMIVEKDNAEFMGAVIPKKGIYAVTEWFNAPSTDGSYGMSLTVDWSKNSGSGGVIPAGACYGHVDGSTLTATTYNRMPATVSEYDFYVYGDYIYFYNTTDGGWVVNLFTDDAYSWMNLDYETTDKNQTSYGEILESINGEPVVSMADTFRDCASLVTAPAIPASIIDMERAFFYCINLTTAPDMSKAINVTNMKSAFGGCTALKGSITINATPSEYYGCLNNTQITEILGSCTIKDQILATKNA